VHFTLLRVALFHCLDLSVSRQMRGRASCKAVSVIYYPFSSPYISFMCIQTQHYSVYTLGFLLATFHVSEYLSSWSRFPSIHIRLLPITVEADFCKYLRITDIILSISGAYILLQFTSSRSIRRGFLIPTKLLLPHNGFSWLESALHAHHLNHLSHTHTSYSSFLSIGSKSTTMSGQNNMGSAPRYANPFSVREHGQLLTTPQRRLS
jgi:hypothetical protein